MVESLKNSINRSLQSKGNRKIKKKQEMKSELSCKQDLA